MRIDADTNVWSRDRTVDGEGGGWDDGTFDAKYLKYSTVRYIIVRYSTVQYSTVLYSTLQYSTVYRRPYYKFIVDITVVIFYLCCLFSVCNVFTTPRAGP